MAQWTAFAAVAVILGSVADAIPTISFPINSQVPPVARISEPFSYTFSESTFSSDLPLSYNLLNAPSWLSLDSSTRTLSGTPTPNDVGTETVTGFNIDLTASDRTGSVTLNATLVISTNPAPVINIPLSAQLASFGLSSFPSTLLCHPSTNFEFNFTSETFKETGGAPGLNYYSVTLDNTPLPSWIHFDGSTLSYTGLTPDYESLIQPPQTFGLQLIASDVEGFAGASIPFEIEVGVHLLGFKTTQMVINATVGLDINFDGLSNNLELDGAPINRSSLASVAAQTPSWMTFNNNTFVLSGTVPADALSTNVTVQATDIYGDTDTAVVFVDVVTAIFNSPIKNLNVSAGSPFSFDFSSYLRNTSDVEMAAQFSPMTSWIKFDSKTFIMSGEVPSSAPASKISVTLVATSKSSQSSTSQSFSFLVNSGQHPISLSAPSASSSSSTTAHAASSNTTTPSSISSHKRPSNGVIAAIVVPITLLVLSAILALCCYRQRRRAAKKRSSKSPTKSEVSAPVEVESSIVEIIGPPRVPPPAPLELDTSGFTTENSSSTYTNEQEIESRNLADNPLRRSQTMSAVSGLLSSEFRQSDIMRARAYSDNGLTRTDKSWRTTQDSAYPTISSSSRTNSSNRLTRNYSKKGQQERRSVRIRSRNSALRDSAVSIQRRQSTILNLGDSNFSSTPVDHYSALSKRTTTIGTSDFAYVGNRLQYTRSARRKSKIIQDVDQRASVDNGGRDSTVSIASLAEKRRSVGQGQNWELARRPSDPRHRLTVNFATTGREQDSLSNVSAITENTAVLEDQVAPLNTRTIHPSRNPRSSATQSDSSTSTRPVSRRVVGSSPFFAGNGSMRRSRASPNKARTSYADSPTVPEEVMIGGLDDFVRSELRPQSMTPRDSFGISYGAAREGTRQLKSYLQSRLSRRRTNGSLKSNESRESRIESVDSQPNIVIHGRTPEPTQPKAGEEEEYEDYLPDDYSESSWETHRTPPRTRDSLGNIIGYGLGESSQVATPVAQRHLVPSTALRSHPTSPLSPDIGPNARMVSGRGKRPLSVDAGANKGSVRGVVEDDYTVFL